MNSFNIHRQLILVQKTTKKTLCCGCSDANLCWSQVPYRHSLSRAIPIPPISSIYVKTAHSWDWPCLWHIPQLIFFDIRVVIFAQSCNKQCPGWAGKGKHTTSLVKVNGWLALPKIMLIKKGLFTYYLQLIMEPIFFFLATQNKHTYIFPPLPPRFFVIIVVYNNWFFSPSTSTFYRELKHTAVFLCLLCFVTLIESFPHGHKHMLIFYSAGWIAHHFTPTWFRQICHFFTFNALGNDNMSWQ